MPEKSKRTRFPNIVHKKAHFLMEQEKLTREQAYGKAIGMFNSGLLNHDVRRTKKHVK